MNTARRCSTLWRGLAQVGAILSAATLLGGYVVMTHRARAPHLLQTVPEERAVAPSSEQAILVRAVATLDSGASLPDEAWPPVDDKDPRIPAPVRTVKVLPTPAPTRKSAPRTFMPGSKHEDNLSLGLLGILKAPGDEGIERVRNHFLYPRPPETVVMPGSKSSGMPGEWMVAQLMRRMVGAKPDAPVEKQKDAKP